MDYEYQITEGGTYTVKAYAPEDVAETTSNEVEVNDMTVKLTSAKVVIGECPDYHFLRMLSITGKPSLQIEFEFEISDPIAGLSLLISSDSSIEFVGIAVQERKIAIVDTITAQSFKVKATAVVYRASSAAPTVFLCFDNNELDVTTYTQIIELKDMLYLWTTENLDTGTAKKALSIDLNTITKLQSPTINYTLTDYTNELTIKTEPLCPLIVLLKSVTATFEVPSPYTISGWNTYSETSFEDKNFINHIPFGAAQVTFDAVFVDETKVLFEQLPSSTVVKIKQLGTPVLTYSATEGKLHWDEVEGADRYEVWKDGVKVADIPKKT